MGKRSVTIAEQNAGKIERITFGKQKRIVHTALPTGMEADVTMTKPIAASPKGQP